MKLKVLEWNEDKNAHMTRINGARCYVDFLIDDTLNQNTDPQRLVGKTIEVDDVQLYVGLAINPRIVEG